MKKLSTFQRIRELKPNQSIYFAATILSRMTPHYTMYMQAIDNAEQAPIAEHIMGLIWQRLSDPKQTFNLGVQIEKVEEALPDPSVTEEFGALPAIDAGLGLVAIMRFWQQSQDDAAVMVAKLAQGGVEAMLLATDFATDFAEVQSLDDEEAFDIANRKLNQELKNHPLMAFETQWQNEVLDYIASTKSKNKQLVSELQALAKDTGITTLGIELV